MPIRRSGPKQANKKLQHQISLRSYLDFMLRLRIYSVILGMFTKSSKITLSVTHFTVAMLHNQLLVSKGSRSFGKVAFGLQRKTSENCFLLLFMFVFFFFLILTV